MQLERAEVCEWLKNGLYYTGWNCPKCDVIVVIDHPATSCKCLKCGQVVSLYTKEDRDTRDS